MRKQHILLAASLMSLASPVLGAAQVHAIGPSPAFEKTEDISQERLRTDPARRQDQDPVGCASYGSRLRRRYHSTRSS